MSVAAPSARPSPAATQPAALRETRPSPHRQAPRRPLGGRALERRLLLWLLPVALLGALGVSRSTGAVQIPLPEAARALGIVVAGCLILHLLLSITRFDGDPLILPALSLIFVIGAAYHMGLPRAAGGTSIGP